jgi:hypothetical protein
MVAAARTPLRDLASAPGRRDGRRRADQPAEQERAQLAVVPFAVHENDCTVAGVRICALGDLLLDVVVRLERPLVRGDELGLPPGPEVGRLLELIEEERAAGAISTREEALALARRAVR